MRSDIMSSRLSDGEKAEALAMLAALEQYGDADYIRKTLLGIQMQGGAEAFFKDPGGPARYALADSLRHKYDALQAALEQNKKEQAKLPVWSKLFPSKEYQRLQREQADIEEKIIIAQKRLDQLNPEWQGVNLWDWGDVSAEYEKMLGEDAEAEDAKGAEEEEPEEKTPDKAPASGKRPNSEAKPIEELEISDAAIDVLIDREGSDSYLREKDIAELDSKGNLIGIYPHYVNDGGITIGYGHRITKKDIERDPEEAALYKKYTRGAGFDGSQGTRVKSGIAMPIKVAYALMLKDIEGFKSRLMKGLKEKDALDKVSLTQQEFDALMLISFNKGNVESAYRLLVENNRNRSDWEKMWGGTGDIALDIFFDGEYGARRK